MKKKILYLFSDTGGGHRAAATAIMSAVDQLAKNEYHQEMIDVFATCSGFLNVFAKLYAPVIKYSPKLWGQLYYMLQDEKKLEQLEFFSRPFILKELTELIKKKHPTVIVSVHPLVNHLTVKAIKDSGLDIPFIVVITDPFTLPRAWIAPEVNLCVVATPEARKRAIKYGMPAKKIKVIGMPIDPKFIQASKQKRLKKAKPFTVLLMGGGEGGGGMHELVREFADSGFAGRLIVIAGRNEKLAAKLKDQADQLNFPLQVYGFTDQVHSLMGESDILVTKAGPGTIAEAMAMNLPIIITSWLPGQEEGNVEFVKRENVGRVSQDPKKIVDLVNQMREPKEYLKIKENIKRVSRPGAALEIAREIFHYL